MKSQLYKAIILSSLLATLIACEKSKSGWLGAPPTQPDTITETADDPTFDFSPKAEIVFVIDVSASMEKHLQNLRKNIPEFVRAFSKNNPLQYNLAVVSVYDKKTFSTPEYLSKWGSTDKFFKLGQFRQVKKSSTETVPDKFFISSQDENLEQLLQNTLDVGIQGTAKGGPEFEESFSPIAAIYGHSKYKIPEELVGRQQKFSMGKDSYKIIFFVTDASDNSGLSASDLYSHLAKLSRDQNDEMKMVLPITPEERSKVLAFGAIVPSDVSNCIRDPAGKPVEIENFLKMTKRSSESSNVVSLCGSFGESFAAFGKSVRNRVATQVVHLKNRVPVMTANSKDAANVCAVEKTDPNQIYDHLHVCYGTQEIPMETTAAIIGYRYSPDQNAIQINGNFEFNMQPGAKLRLLYTAIDSQLLQRGKVKRYGQ